MKKKSKLIIAIKFFLNVANEAFSFQFLKNMNKNHAKEIKS